ncbi:hypothetical protein Gpo141_00003766 [Globisporangium polare]
MAAGIGTSFWIAPTSSPLVLSEIATDEAPTSVDADDDGRLTRVAEKYVTASTIDEAEIDCKGCPLDSDNNEGMCVNVNV